MINTNPATFGQIKSENEFNKDDKIHKSEALK